MSKRTHVYVVGAGFSKYAGLPLQLDFTEATQLGAISSELNKAFHEHNERLRKMAAEKLGPRPGSDEHSR